MNLYRRRTFWASLIVLLACVAGFTALAQRRKPHKLRATALLELTTDNVGIITARLTPITILDEGSFHDASIYKATPRPMAVDEGVVYEAQKSGQPFGYVTITSAGRTTGGWTALGKWQLASAMAKSTPTPTPSGPIDDRPVLHRGGGTAASGQSAPGAASPSPSPAETPASVEVSQPEDPNRPVLRHRGPETKSQPADQPGPKPAATPAPQGVPAPKVAVPTPGTQTMVAVSDAESTDSRSFEFVWKPGEKAQMEAKMRRLALAKLPRENAQLTDHSLTKVIIRSFDLDLSNDAVMVLSAEVPSSYVAQGNKSEPGKFVSRYITLIARIDLQGNPQRLSASVTDSSRLDIVPRLELIDAVDVDGDGYAELLFRQYSFDEKSFIIYGVGRSSVTKVFEGASSPLK
jgi:hypothetical protein